MLMPGTDSGLCEPITLGVVALTTLTAPVRRIRESSGAAQPGVGGGFCDSERDL
jgi:hypothetical protein